MGDHAKRSRATPRYHFNLKDRSRTIPDNEGTELLDEVRPLRYACKLGQSRPNWPVTRLETLHAAGPSRARLDPLKDF